MTRNLIAAVPRPPIARRRAANARVLVLGDVDAGPFYLGQRGAAFRRKRRCRWWISSAKASCPAARPTSRATSPIWASPPNCFGVVGHDAAADQLQQLLCATRIGCPGLLACRRPRHQRQDAHCRPSASRSCGIDRETRGDLDGASDRAACCAALDRNCPERADAVIVGDYGKGVVTQPLLEELKGTLPQPRRLAQPRSQAGPSFESVRPLANHAQPQGSLRAGRTCRTTRATPTRSRTPT